MTTYTVKISPFSPVAFAVPGIREVNHGDFVKFHNMTNGPIEISMAARGVLKSLTRRKTAQLAPGETSDPFEVIAKSGTHEYSAHYEYTEKKAGTTRTRAGFANGSSSPKIIVVPPKK